MISLKNYFEQTSAKVKKIGLWIKGLVGTAAGSAYIQGDAKLAFYALIAGAAITGLLELLPPEKPAAPGSDSKATPLTSVAPIILVLMLFGLWGCTVVKPQVDRTKTDTTLTTYKQVDINVKGATVTAGLNLDSLYHVALMKLDQAHDDSIQKANQYKQDSIAAIAAHKPIPPKPVYLPSPPTKQYVTDPQTKAQLSYWIDQYGKLQLGCQSKDQVVQTLQAQVTKLSKDTTTTTQVVTQTPAWAKDAMIIEGILLLLAILFIVLNRK